MTTCFCLPSEKGSTLKEKNLIPQAANSFLLVHTHFSKRLGVRKVKQEVKKVVSLAKMAENLPSVCSPLNKKQKKKKKKKKKKNALCKIALAYI